MAELENITRSVTDDGRSQFIQLREVSAGTQTIRSLSGVDVTF
ncbi:hypothetical protein ACKFKF_19690 [Phormidesmis sp. 146-12]